MIEHTQLLRIKKLKGNGIIAIAARHNLREIQAEIGADSHIDPHKTSLNVVLRGAGRAADVAAEAFSLMEQADVLPLRKAKKEQWQPVVGLEIIFSLPPSSVIAELYFFSDAVAWAQQFFEIPILSAVIHNDEAAPHCHVILLPLFNGRMTGNKLIGNKHRLLSMQADFYTKVGQGYGLKRGTPAKRYSGAARATAADRIVTALRRAKNSLDDPAIRDALRDAIVETMPVHLMELLGLDIPEVRTPTPKTFAGIMIQNKPERKHKKAIAIQSKANTIAIDTVISDQKEQSLSCVAFPDSPLLVPPDNAPLQDEYVREREEDQPADYWDGEIGKFIRPLTKPKMKSSEIERVRGEIKAMQR